VGKTSLILQLSEGQFVSSCGNTLGLDFTTKTLKIGDERIVFQLWDTAGQERYEGVCWHGLERGWGQKNMSLICPKMICYVPSFSIIPPSDSIMH